MPRYQMSDVEPPLLRALIPKKPLPGIPGIAIAVGTALSARRVPKGTSV